MNTNTTEFKSLTLNEWYGGLPANQQISTRNKIIEECGITAKTFYNWKAGLTIPNISHQRDIIRIAGQPISFKDDDSELTEGLQLVK